MELWHGRVHALTTPPIVSSALFDRALPYLAKPQRLRKASEDPMIGAIVLRIDSGGGSAVASDSIAAAVELVRQVRVVPTGLALGLLILRIAFGHLNCTGAPGDRYCLPPPCREVCSQADNDACVQSQVCA